MKGWSADWCRGSGQARTAGPRTSTPTPLAPGRPGGRRACPALDHVTSRAGNGDELTIRTVDAIVRALSARLELRSRGTERASIGCWMRIMRALVETVANVLRSLGMGRGGRDHVQPPRRARQHRCFGYHPATRTILVVEVKSVVPDVQATLLVFDRKTRLATEIARQRGWVAPGVAASWWSPTVGRRDGASLPRNRVQEPVPAPIKSRTALDQVSRIRHARSRASGFWQMPAGRAHVNGSTARGRSRVLNETRRPCQIGTPHGTSDNTPLTCARLA